MTNTQINLVVIRSADLDRAAEFYSLLGLDFTKHSHGTGPQHYACELAGLVFEIYPIQKDGDTTTGTRIGFRVDSVDVATKQLEEAGAKVISSPKESPWGRRAVLADLDGHRIELTSPSSSPD